MEDHDHKANCDCGKDDDITFQTVISEIPKKETNATAFSNATQFSKTMKQRRDILKRGGQAMRFVGAKRNEPCPCGSGKKFKRCCHSTVDL